MPYAGVLIRHMPRCASCVPFIAAAIALVLLLSGCFRLPVPDPGMRELRDLVERRLLHDAKQAFLRTDYAEAIPLLHRFVRTHPHSPRSPEARWWLARSYQESGHLSSAAGHFRLLADARRPNPYRAEALVRAAQLENLPGEPTGGPAHGIMVSLASLRLSDDWTSIMPDVHTSEGAIVLLDVPCGLDDAVLRDKRSPLAMDAVIRRLHRQGTAVYLGVTLRCLGDMAEDRRGALEPWRDWNYHPPPGPRTAPTSGGLRRSSHYGLEFWGYREFLVEWLSRLRGLPLTGLVFRTETSSGMDEGFSPLALQAFQREFGVNFDPVRILDDHGSTLATGSGADAQLPAVWWKWAGWKARARLRVLRDLVDTLRVRLPHLRFGLEVRRQSVADPVYGLLHFAEDWADVARGPFDVFLTTITDTSPGSPHAASHGSPATRDSAPGGAGAVWHMVQVLGQPEKVWAVLPRRAYQARNPPWRLPNGVGRVYDYRVVP